ncbi:MAG TPA: glycosyltransferase family 2 protein [Candidatus Angelobacter sp.]|nr:glycosyltransferase family 2 protein [Candidatus Angelobacter sp.]
MTKRLLLGAHCFAVTILLLLFPALHACVVVGNFIVHAFVLGLQLVTTRLPRVIVPRRRRLDHEPFVSIHVPTHNEPPDLLIQTLQSLGRIKWANFEVLVIDNNTTDPRLWRPVEACCRELGARFRFFHVENLKGFKAGALNYVRQFMHPRSEFVFVVDADYVVERDCLRRAVRYFTDPNVGLVQFPQEYRNIGKGNWGVALDFKHFFAAYMNMANRFECVPSTGTLSLISVAALRSTEGFSENMITEDADLGLRLTLRGYKSIYVHEAIGYGVLPHDLESLKKQRWRWAFGNAQILKLNWRHILFSGELRWRQKLGFLAHLTAWFNFNLIPSLSLILLAPLALLGLLSPLQHYIVVLSGLTLTTFMVLRFGTLFYGLRRDGHSLREIWLAYFTHLSLGWVFSASWLNCLWDHRSPFVRTNKFITRRVPGFIQTVMAELALGTALLAAGILLTVTDFVIGPAAACLMCVSRFAIVWVWHQMRHTFQLSCQVRGSDKNRGDIRGPVRSDTACEVF